MLQRDIAGNGNDSNTALGDGGLHGNFEHARHLLRLRYQLAVMAALREEMLGIRLLKISAADFPARNLCGDGEDGNAAALTVVKAIDQMHVAGAATSGAYRQLASEMGLGAGGECCCLLVSYTNPTNVLSNANRIRNSVEGVAGDSIDPFHASIDKNVYQQFGYCFSHHIHPSIDNDYVLSKCGSDNFATGPGTRVGAGLPFNTASTLSKASMPMAVRVSIVALPIC